MKALAVRLHGRPCGALHADADGGIVFEYAADWLAARATAPTPLLSLSLPPRPAPFPTAQAAPFFDNLLPEARQTRRALGRFLQVDADDTPALLEALGQECPGAVSIHADGEPVLPEERVRPRLRRLGVADLAGHIRALPSRPLFIDADGELRLSLAGVRHKAGVLLEDNQVALPLEGTPTTFILKTDVDGLPDSVRVEHFCLELARATGLDAPRSSLRLAEDQVYLLVARFDRAMGTSRDGPYIHRIHQEDFCQALARYPREKYEKDGGPGWAEAFALMERMRDPARDRAELLRRAVFQYLIGNPDAHAKNYAIVHRRGGPGLAKLYDVNNAAAFRHHYKEVRPRLAMAIGGSRDPDALDVENWRRFALETRLRPELVIQELVTMARRLLVSGSAVRDNLRGTPADCAGLDIAVADIKERAARVIAAMGE